MREKQIKKQLEQLRRDMIFVEGGSFMMGSDRYDSEKPIHEVVVQSFYLCKYPVTQQLWETIFVEVSYFKGEKRPVETISWDDAQGFIEELNKIGKKFNHELSYRLPSEAEWEYAARGGVHKDHHAFEYAGGNHIDELTWYVVNSNNETKAVGQKQPNALGLYDMSGNVWEWCEDKWHENYEGAPNDGKPWLEEDNKHPRVVRGGSWNENNDNCRVSKRLWVYNDGRDYGIGCRLLGALAVR
jgi:formylglycine-generating enzyme required for sulfatase activity